MTGVVLTVSTKSIYLYNGKKYNAVKSLSKANDDFVVVKAIDTEEELTVSVYEFRNSFKLEKFTFGKTFCL